MIQAPSIISRLFEAKRIAKMSMYIEAITFPKRFKVLFYDNGSIHEYFRSKRIFYKREEKLFILFRYENRVARVEEGEIKNFWLN